MLAKAMRFFRGMGRWAKYKYLLLFRAKGGAVMVAKGFSIGLFIEMFTFPTAGLAFFLIFPLVYFFRASLAGALIGFVFGKFIYIPFAFLNNKVGGFVLTKQLLKHHHFKVLPYWLGNALIVNLKLVVGGMIVGTILAFLAYFPVKWLLEYYTHRRKAKRKQRKLHIMANHNKN